jgi:hypothetical protein
VEHLRNYDWSPESSSSGSPDLQSLT